MTSFNRTVFMPNTRPNGISRLLFTNTPTGSKQNSAKLLAALPSCPALPRCPGLQGARSRERAGRLQGLREAVQGALRPRLRAGPWVGEQSPQTDARPGSTLIASAGVSGF